MTAPRTQDAQPLARRPSLMGCLGAIGLVLCAAYVLIVGTSGGLLAYGFAYWLGAPSFGASIAGGILAFGMACLTTPVGAGLFIALDAMNRSPAESIAGFVLAAIVAPIVRSGEVLLFASLTAVCAGLILWFCQPAMGSILLALLSTLSGLVIGVLLCGGDDNDTS